MKSLFKPYAYFYFALALLGRSSGKKVANYVRLKVGFATLIKNKKWIKTAMPIALSIEPTTACNLGCSQCPSGLKSFHRPTGNIDVNQATTWINELKDYLYYINFYFQGEPLIHPKINELIAHATKCNISSAISTNAHFLSPAKCEALVNAGLSKIIISLDGIKQKSYERYREGGEIQKVTSGIKNLVAAKKKLKKKHPLIEVQFIVFKQNEDEIPQLKSFVKKLGADMLSLKTAQIYDQSSAEELLPKQDKYLRYKKNNAGVFELKNNFKNQCWRMYSSAVITQNGDVVPCCFDKDADYAMGNVNMQSFKAINQSGAYKNFGEKVFNARKQIDICQNCSEGSKIY